MDARFHDSFKPRFANDNVVVYSLPGSAPQVSGDLRPAMRPLVGERKDIRFSKFVSPADVNPITLIAQKEGTTIDTSDGFPAARVPTNVAFTSFAHNIEGQLSINVRESPIWTLCSILFDPTRIACSEIMAQVPSEKHDEYADRMRMDAFGEFWAELVSPYVQDGMRRARTAEEKALLYLTQNEVVAACDALTGARDFKLAMLVSQLPGTESSRTLMQNQIAAWRTRNDWSEMSEPIRAIFSILAGETGFVQGKDGAAEDKVADFNIAERFALSWQQSFALNLFFGGHDSIEGAIQAYSADLESGEEHVQPTCTWDNRIETRDTMMDLMRLFAGDQDPMPMLDPLAISGNSLNSRLTWQLASLLNAKGICKVSNECLDQLTHDFAVELEIAGKLVSSAWILLHLSDRSAREKAMEQLLERQGRHLSTPGPDAARGSFEDLVNDLHVPASIVWRAKAFYAKDGLHNPALQTAWLLQAGDTADAHEVLCTTLGPQAVIEQDYDVLSRILQTFPRHLPDGWQQGGQVYSAFMQLTRAHQGQRWNRDDQASMERLKRGLAAMEDDGRKKGQEERVAIIEMGRVLEEVLREHGDPDEDRQMSGTDFTDGASSMGADLLNKYQRAMGVVA